MDKTLAMDSPCAIFRRFEVALVVRTELFCIASAHNHDIHEFNINDHGMHIGEPFRSVADILAMHPVHVEPIS